MVPMAYSTVDIPDSSTASMANRTFNWRKTLFIFVFPPHWSSYPRRTREATNRQARSPHA
jgi:hypothetical protein